jgi:phosphate transport system substrate-binding protein
MHSFKIHLLAGVSALLFAAGTTAPASALELDGGGSSLIAPYIGQAMDCHTASTAGHVSVVGGSFAACGTGDSDTRHDGSTVFKYFLSSSGTGITAFLNMNTGALGTGALQATFAMADSPMTADDIGYYNNGTADAGRSLPATLTPPSSTRGALIQVPASIDPVAVAFNPQYATGKSFTIHTTDGRVHLDANAYCGIFKHTITTWDDAALTSLNGGFSLTGTDTGVAIHLYGRSDSSGTTNIFTRHLATVCGSTNATNPYHDDSQGSSQLGTSTLPTAVVSNFTLASGSFNLATAVGGVPGAIVYIGPDYTTDFNSVSNAVPGVSISAAELINHNNSTLYLPNGTNATAAFTASGFSVPSTPSDPKAWVPTSQVADPSSGYPIIGTTNFILYTKYPDATIGAATVTALTAPRGVSGTDGFLTWYYTANRTASPVELQSTHILDSVGLAGLPTSFTSAIFNNFISSSGSLKITH